MGDFTQLLQRIDRIKMQAIPISHVLDILHCYKIFKYIVNEV